MKTIAFFGTIAFLLMGCSNTIVPEVALGAKSPGFSLQDLDGQDINLKAYTGKPLIINFWATWCQPCLKELPALKTLSDRKDIDIVGIALDEGGQEKVQRFVKRNKIGFKVLLGDQKIFRQFDGYSIPYTLVLNREHEVVQIHRGPAKLEDLEADIRHL